MGGWSVGEPGTHWVQLAVFTVLELVRISELMLWKLHELFVVNSLVWSNCPEQRLHYDSFINVCVYLDHHIHSSILVSSPVPLHGLFKDSVNELSCKWG